MGRENAPHRHTKLNLDIMNIENSLISTALLALQQSGELRFTMNGGDNEDKSGFWFKGYANEDEDDETQLETFIYMNPESPTGYSVMVDILDDETLTILDKPIESFRQFQLIFRPNYIQEVFDAHHKN